MTVVIMGERVFNMEGWISYDSQREDLFISGKVNLVFLQRYFEEREKGYIVRYAAHVVRTELFEALESGLWLRAGYGVSIGGSGVPVKADDDGLVFGEDFTFIMLPLQKNF